MSQRSYKQIGLDPALPGAALEPIESYWNYWRSRKQTTYNSLGQPLPPRDLGGWAKEFAEEYAAHRQAKLEEALAESVKLQSHYAMLLNGWDGGRRRQFKDSEEWLARLKRRLPVSRKNSLTRG